MDLSTINLQPLLDLLSKAGVATSEYQKAKAAGRVALVLFALGALGMIAGLVTNAFGAQSKIGIIAGAAAAIGGVIAQAITSFGYSAARADTKQAAAGVAAAAISSAPAK